ncbi:MAG: hypothetical protein A2901_09680 [Elusimicrobia bacterium RIFCSPLOWO2_01_FULL_54_10]|nr:MAG: hypothetical protein A2901_09680 [Elusimicrobia bacterium RIFCSPLOWO2_01_FULL_54_10]
MTAAETASSLEQKAHALFFKGMISKSIQAYKNALQLDPNAASVYLNLSCAFRALSDPASSLDALDRALVLRPGDPDIMAEAAWALRHLGNHSEAVRRFEEALKISPNHLNALLGLGVSRLEGGQAEESVPAFKRVCELRPNFGGSVYFLYRAYRKIGRIEEANQQYALALRRDWTLREEESAIIKAPSSPQKLPELKLTSIVPLDTADRTSAIRVGLWSSAIGRPPALGVLELESGGPFRVVGTKSGKILAAGQPGERWTVRASKNGLTLSSTVGTQIEGILHGIAFEPDGPTSTFLVQDVRVPDGDFKTVPSREFRGSLTFYPERRGAKFFAVNELPLDEYLLGVLPSEMPSIWPLEGLKAQAVIARNYALLKKSSMRAHMRNHYNICDSQHCQVYQGVKAEKERTNQAVRETAGKLLYFGDQLVYSYYFSTCGGVVQSSRDMPGWGNHAYLHGKADLEGGADSAMTSPWEFNLWLKSVPASNCNDPALIPNSEYRWLRIVSAGALERKLRKFRLGKIKEIIPLSRASSGRLTEVLVRGTRRNAVIKREHQIRNLLGEESLRSTLFMVEAHAKTSGPPAEFWFYGGGWGHGIGLCQAGAAGLAKNSNKTYEEILAFYYEGSRVGEQK